MRIKNKIDWLRSRGGRWIEDVKVDSNGEEYVIMSNAKGRGVRVYIPEFN